MNQSLKLNIRINGYYIRILIFFLCYLILVLGSKGEFHRGEGSDTMEKVLVGLAIGMLLKIPLFFVDMLPIVVSVSIILCNVFEKPVKKLFFISTIFLMVYHGVYFILGLFIMDLEWKFLASFICFVVLFCHFLFVKEEKARAKEPFFQRQFEFRINKYNMVVGGVMLVLFGLTLLSPLFVPGDGTKIVIWGIDKVARWNKEVFLAVEGISKDMGKVVFIINLFTNLLKVPFLIILMIQIIKILRCKEDIFTMPKHFLVIGVLTYWWIPSVFRLNGVEGILKINTSFSIMLYLLLGMALGEFLFIDKIHKELTMIGHEETNKLLPFVQGVKKSNFTLERFLSFKKKIPFIGR